MTRGGALGWGAFVAFGARACAPGALGGDVTLSALEDGFFALLRDYGPPRPSRTSRGDGDRSRAAPAAAAALTASG